jgi:hypothetical protein
MDEGRKRVLLIAASIIAARKLKITMADEVFHYPQGAVDAFARQLNAEVRLVALPSVLIYFIAFPYHSL